jgi:hypothetical protein
LKIPIKVETQDKTMINIKGTELTLKLSTNMVSPSQKLLFEAHSHQFLTQNSRKGFWQPRGIPGMGMVERNGRWDGLFIGKACHQLSDRGTNVWQP